MKCLAVNTATKTLSLAIVDEGRVLHRFETPETRDQGNVLLEHVRQGLEKCGLRFADLDLLVVVTGPGSFTGIRVGLAAMRGVALAADKPVMGMTSFDMFAAHVGNAINIVAVESWREELFFAVLDEEGHAMMECMNVAPEVFVRRFRQAFPKVENIVLSGDAAEKMVAHFPQAAVASEAAAADVARRALKKFAESGVSVPPFPYYLREADVTVSPHVQRTLAAQEE